MTIDIRIRSRALVATAAAAFALVAVSCASTQSATERRTTTIDENRRVFRSTDNGVKVTFRAPRDSVWRALVGAYTDVGLLPELADTSSWVVARMNVPMRRVYDGKRMSLLFSCGEDASGRANADNGQIVASSRSQITGEGTDPGTRVSTLVDAYLIPDGGTSSNAMHCGSTGLLEARLHKAVSARLGLIDYGS